MEVMGCTKIDNGQISSVTAPGEDGEGCSSQHSLHFDVVCCAQSPMREFPYLDGPPCDGIDRQFGQKSITLLFVQFEHFYITGHNIIVLLSASGIS